MENNIKIALCEGRHVMPEGVIGAIYPNTVDPTDLDILNDMAKAFIASHIGETVDVYVTGLTVALVAVIMAANNAMVGLTLWHYDRDTGDYYPQVVKTLGE